LIEAETSIKTFAAVHSQCPLWVKNGHLIPPEAHQNGDL
jgi:hypothetical protein